jgi:hypothetical protein
MNPRITFLVTVFTRPLNLFSSLGSLVVQTDSRWEAVILNNGQPSYQPLGIFLAMRNYAPLQLDYRRTANPQEGWDDYWASELAVEQGWARGKYICCASDDNYYVPEFVQVMCDAADENSWDLAYCDVLYDARGAGKRSILTAAPQCCSIDKTAFIVRRDKWIGFPTKNTGPYKPTQCDGEAVEEMVRRGYSHGRVDQVLVVHN